MEKGSAQSNESIKAIPLIEDEGSTKKDHQDNAIKSKIKQ